MGLGVGPVDTQDWGGDAFSVHTGLGGVTSGYLGFRVAQWLHRAWEVAQWLSPLAAFTGDPSSVASTHFRWFPTIRNSSSRGSMHCSGPPRTLTWSQTLPICAYIIKTLEGEGDNIFLGERDGTLVFHADCHHREA